MCQILNVIAWNIATLVSKQCYCDLNLKWGTNPLVSQINTVVSGALDRLHSEKDPCVKYEVNRKLWIYLHRSRTIEEFGKYAFYDKNILFQTTWVVKEGLISHTSLLICL